MAFLQSTRYDSVPKRTISRSISHQQRCQLDDHFINRLDLTEVLGGEDSLGHPIGHTGCVNALAWSPSGQLLASGSDDRNVVLWKLGSEHLHPVADSTQSPRNRSPISSRYATSTYPRGSRDTQTGLHSGPDLDVGSPRDDEESDQEVVRPWPQRSFPSLDLGMLGKIETGHRANIFSVKWAPNASERRLFTCAGDSHVRVFDINYMSTGSGEGAEGQPQRLSSGREYTVWPEHSGACVRLFRCHRGRAKRISTEASPDVFLTCGEDGDVRQMDLRAPHTCRSRSGGSCPPPLAHYSSVLYSLSVSKLEPWLFAVAGESSLAYLHDRRMIPRLIKREWGMDFNTDPDQDALTLCVRSFGLPPGGFEGPWVENDGRTAVLDEPPQDPNRRRLLLGGRNSITACKLSEHNGRDLLVSYSSGHIYRFDIYDHPGILHANLDNVRFSLDEEERSPSPKGVKTFADDPDEPTFDEGYDVESDQGKGQQNGPEQGDSSSALVSDEVDQEARMLNEDENAEAIDPDEEDTSEDNSEMSPDDDEYTDEGEDLSEDDFANIMEDACEHSGASRQPNVPTVYPRSAYKGHCNKETVKDVGFAGQADNCVISGSDDGNWFMWDKLTSEIRGIWHADSSVVNVMAMHPDLPVFAISGIDDTIKIFAPVSDTPFPPVPGAGEEPDLVNAEEGRRRRARRAVDGKVRTFRIADRLPDKDEIVDRNERQMQRDFVTPAASLLWRLHPRLLGIDVDSDPERQIEGDCTVM